MLNLFKEVLGRCVGILEFIGLKYSVTPYKARVSSSLWRGSRLEKESDYINLKQKGFNLIINLCAERDLDSKMAVKTGILALRLSIMDNTTPTLNQVSIFLRLVTDTRNCPVFVHCEAGKGRTGIMVACYRISVEGWDTERAIIEARSYGLTLESQVKFIRNFSKENKK